MTDSITICNTNRTLDGWTCTGERMATRKTQAKAEPGEGFVYAVRIEVIQGFSLLKIGATTAPYERFLNFGNRASLFCLSPPHKNFFENESILHECFSSYRIPRGPAHKGTAELFNISMTYFLESMPELELKK